VKVDPVQLDLFAVSLPGVTDACAFGYLDSAGLQQVGLALVTRPDVNGNALAAALQQAFGSASPRTIVRVEEIPRNAMGKPLRRAFTELHSVAPSS
jgi:acyl-coenzyme A synthetase/AMP-(fatty) acid ligase